MLVTREDVPADFIARDLAVQWANEKFEKWCKDNQVCTHPKDKIRARILNWDAEKCQFFCECGKRMEITKWVPALIQEKQPSFTSDIVIR